MEKAKENNGHKKLGYRVIDCTCILFVSSIICNHAIQIPNSIMSRIIGALSNQSLDTNYVEIQSSM